VDFPVTQAAVLSNHTLDLLLCMCPLLSSSLCIFTSLFTILLSCCKILIRILCMYSFRKCRLKELLSYWNIFQYGEHVFQYVVSFLLPLVWKFLFHLCLLNQQKCKKN
jgi:hypothetical protein